MASAEAVLERASTLDLPSLNESNTKRLLIEPILAALGWDLFNVASVYSEYRVYDGTFLDYALLVDSKAVLFCEAKPTAKRLDDPKWVSQTVNYANNEGVVWCVLTDGLRWRVFKANEAVSMDRKLAFEVKLAEVADPSARERALRLFACLTPAAVADGQLTALGTQVFVDGRVRAALAEILEQPDKRLVDLLRSRIGTEARLTPADIKAALARVAAPALATLDTELGPVAPPAPSDARPLDAKSAGTVLEQPGAAAYPSSGGCPTQSPDVGGLTAGRPHRPAQDRAGGNVPPRGPAGVKISRTWLAEQRRLAVPSGTVVSFDSAGEGRTGEVREALTAWLAGDPARGRARIEWEQGSTYLVWENDGKAYTPTALTRAIAAAATGADPLSVNRGTRYWLAGSVRLSDIGSGLG